MSDSVQTGHPAVRLWSRNVLVVVLAFGAISAFGGGVLGVFANGAGVPLTYLANSPFESYLVPGMILGIVIGGTQLSAGLALLRKHRSGYVLAVVAGFGMLIWIFVELAVIGEYSWLQTVYFAVGIIELLLVYVHIGLLCATAGTP